MKIDTIAPVSCLECSYPASLASDASKSSRVEFFTQDSLEKKELLENKASAKNNQFSGKALATVKYVTLFCLTFVGIACCLYWGAQGILWLSRSLMAYMIRPIGRFCLNASDLYLLARPKFYGCMRFAINLLESGIFSFIKLFLRR